MRSRGVADSTAEILHLIEALRADRGGTPAPQAGPRATPARLEVERWREAFYCDGVAARLASVCSLLEERLDALEGEVRASPRGAPAGDADPRAWNRPRSASGAQAPLPCSGPGEAAPPAGSDALLRGQIQEGVLSDILQMLSANLKTGKFTIEGPSGATHLWYQDGEIRHAAADNLAGEDAFFAAISQPSGAFFFVETNEAPPAQTINNKTQFLILEGLRKMDEEGLTGPEPEGEEHPA